MALRRREFRDDVLWLRWPIAYTALSTLVAVALWWGAASLRNETQRREFNAINQLDLLAGQVREIEEAERVIVNNIGVFNRMEARGIMAGENRVALLDTIGDIRARYDLYPIAVDISEQNLMVLDYPQDVDFPDEQISLGSSRVTIQLPLLHEGDLTRLLDDLLASGPLMVVDYCSINQALQSQESYLTLVPHQLAECGLTLYTFERAPYDEFSGEEDF